MDPKVAAHIAESGLTPGDLRARELTQVELAACQISNINQEGYVIPYYDIDGKLLPFYRIRLFNYGYKYKQPPKTPSHIYFPPEFRQCLDASVHGCILITEGERKAAAACKAGVPTIGLGGVDSWRSRTLVLDAKTVLEQGKQGSKSVILAKVPSGRTNVTTLTDTVAEGFEDLIDLALFKDLDLVIVYDTDLPEPPYIKTQVQRAANGLAHEMIERGVSTCNIRQMVLPIDDTMEKVGLDDYIISQGDRAFHDLVVEVTNQRVAFPRHPAPKTLVTEALNRGKVSRKEMMTLARNVITEMDCRGIRMVDQNSRMPYYFDEQTRTLMTARLLSREQPLHESPFGAHLHKQYGVSAADNGFINRLAPLYTTESPIDTVEPVRVITTTPDSIILQLSDSEMAVVTDDPVQPIHICSNGHDGILFEQDQVEAVDTALVLKEFQKQMKQPLECWWKDVLDTVNLRGEHDRELASLLYYISPWLRRWRGTQLPVEIVCGEAGSGKSSLFTLRLSILTGRPFLRNIPADIKDWQSSVGSTGGLHVIDNVQFTNKGLRQQLSDEICRIITEPNPHVEMRALYTTSSLHTLPVNTVFAFTSIDQPFHNADLLQRSAVFTVEAVQAGNLQGDWAQTHLESRGGREAWIAHHLVVMHKFLHKVKGTWKKQQGASHRLAHYQQCLTHMGDLFGMDTKWLKPKLTQATTDLISDSDWTLQGIKQFVAEQKEMQVVEFAARDVAEWARYNDEFSSNPLLTSSKRLGRYFVSHKNLVKVSCGVIPGPHKRQNLSVYQILK